MTSTQPPRPATLRLWLLGPWQAQLNGVPLPSLRTRHARALIARLALAHPRPISREQLSTDLFPHVPRARAAHRFRTTLYLLRQVLGDYLNTEGDQIGLDTVLHVEHDVGRFETLSQPGASQGALEAAISLYRSSFLETPGEGWPTQEADRLHNRYVDALRSLVALAQATGTPEVALDAARRWVMEEPWEEAAHVALIQALAAHGHIEAATAHIARAHSMLRAEWNKTPSVSFEAQIREVTQRSKLPPTKRRQGQSPSRTPKTRSPILPSNLADFDRLPLIDRGNELARLHTAWAQARYTAARVLIIEGVAGVGKTRLVSEFASAIRRNADSIVLWGVADEHTAQRSLGLLRDTFVRLSEPLRSFVGTVCAKLDDKTWGILCQYIPELQQLTPERTPLSLPTLESISEAARWRSALIHFIDSLAGKRPLFMVLENGHQADEATLTLVEDIVRGGQRTLLLITRRPETPTGNQSRRSLSPDQTAQVEQSTHAPFETMPLASLGEIATKDLIQAALCSDVDEWLLDRLVRQSGGNPLFVRELLRTLIACSALHWQPQRGWYLVRDQLSLPDPLTNLLTQRLSPLSSLARELAHLIAVVGRPAEQDLLRLLWPDEETRRAAQVELLEHGVLLERNNRLQFDHDWLRETLLDSLDDTMRVQLHRQIAAALETQMDGDPAERMYHHAGAGEWAKALDNAFNAARQALSEGRVVALRHFLTVAEEAIDTLSVAPYDERRWFLLDLRERYASFADRGPTWTAARDALTTFAEASRRPEWRVDVLIRRGNVLHDQVQPHAAERIFRQAIIIASQARLHALEAKARLLLASSLDDQGEVGEALAESAAGLQASTVSADDALHFYMRFDLAYRQMRAGLLEEANMGLTNVVESVDAQRYPLSTPRAMCALGITRVAARDYTTGLAYLRESVRRPQAIGDQLSMLLHQSMLCFTLANIGLYEEARALAETTIPLAHQLKDARQLCVLLASLAKAHLATGEVVQAWSLAKEAADSVAGLPLPEYATGSLGLVAAIALASDRLGEAQEAIEQATPLLSNARAVNIAHIAAQVWLALGQPERARHAAYAAVAQVEGKGVIDLSASKALWTAASVLAVVEGQEVGQSLRERASERFLDDVVMFSEPYLRRAFINASPAHREMAAFAQKGARRLVFLPSRDTPTGRSLYEDELVPVVWMVETSDDPPHGVPRRQRQLQRLASEATAQGAIATVKSLADVLACGIRTITQDLRELRSAGVVIETRRTVGQQQESS